MMKSVKRFSASVYACRADRNMDDFLRIQQELLLWVLEAVEAADAFEARGGSLPGLRERG